MILACPASLSCQALDGYGSTIIRPHTCHKETMPRRTYTALSPWPMHACRCGHGLQDQCLAVTAALAAACPDLARQLVREEGGLLLPVLADVAATAAARGLPRQVRWMGHHHHSPERGEWTACLTDCTPP